MDVEAQPQPQVHPHASPASLPTLNALREGRSSLSFQLPTPSFNLSSGSQINQDPTILGFWHCMTARLNVGINLGASVSQNSVVVQEAMNGNSEVRQDQMSTEFILAPTFKYYTRTQSTVALYFLGQMHFQIFSDGDAITINDPKAMGENSYNPKEDLELALILGFGTEWFPTQSFSLGGHIGLDFDLLRQNQAGIALSTFTSNLTAQIYF
jgi:hypothetical protein